MRRAIVPLFALTAACSLLTTFDGFDVPKVAPTDASAGDADAQPPGPCFHKRWPAPPAAGSPADVGELVAAIRSFGVLSPDPAAPYGFDLDDLCTCAERVACIGAQPGKPCDPNDSGIDNAGSSLFSLFSTLTDAGLDESGLRSGLSSGRFGIVFRITGWNGEPDDPEVRVAVLNAVQVNPGTGGVARFDGRDQWVVDVASVLDRFPLYVSTSAYVAGGVLFASLPRLLANVRIPTVDAKWLLLPVDMANARITARIRRVTGGVELTGGEFGGRIPLPEALAIATSTGACQGSAAYSAARTFVCDARDLPRDPGLDGRDAPCDSLSIGMAFEAIPATVAPDAGVPEEFSPCGDAGAVDDCK